MTKISYIVALFFALLVFSCTSEKPGEFQNEGAEQEIISIGLNLKGELSVSQTPLKTGEAEDSDMFGIQFYDVNDKPYAFVVGDDFSRLSIDLIKNKPYKVKVTYIKNAKELLYYSTDDQEWGIPLQTWGRSGTGLNKVYYTSANELSWISHVGVQPQDLDSGTYAELDRYYGVLESFTPTEDTESLTVDLKRMIFGLKLRLDVQELEDQDLDLLRFSVNTHNGGKVFSLPVSDGLGILEIPYLTIAVPGCESCNVALDFALDTDYEEDISISIGTYDNHTRYFDGNISVQRNKMMVIDHVLEEEETSDGGFGG